MSAARARLNVRKWKSEQVGLQELTAFSIPRLPAFNRACAVRSGAT